MESVLLSLNRPQYIIILCACTHTAKYFTTCSKDLIRFPFPIFLPHKYPDTIPTSHRGVSSFRDHYDDYDETITQLLEIYEPLWRKKSVHIHLTQYFIHIPCSSHCRPNDIQCSSNFHLINVTNSCLAFSPLFLMLEGNFPRRVHRET